MNWREFEKWAERVSDKILTLILVPAMILLVLILVIAAIVIVGLFYTFLMELIK